MRETSYFKWELEEKQQRWKISQYKDRIGIIVREWFCQRYLNSRSDPLRRSKGASQSMK